jgi:hypothetical protein
LDCQEWTEQNFLLPLVKRLHFVPDLVLAAQRVFDAARLVRLLDPVALPLRRTGFLAFPALRIKNLHEKITIQESQFADIESREK